MPSAGEIRDSMISWKKVGLEAAQETGKEG
jgi:hypothetical protein